MGLIWDSTVWEKEVFEKGIKKRNEQIAIKMIKNDESNEKIAFYTGLSINKITEIRERVKKTSDEQEQHDW